MMEITREAFIKSLAMMGAGLLMGNPKSSFEKELLVPDHFLWGCSNLQEGIRLLKEKTGVEAVVGGKHPGIGTHNALISLGNNVYLEIIAPDPDASSLFDDYAFLKDLKSPVLFYWAAHTNDIKSLQKRINELGLTNSGIKPGSRKKPDGTLLEWESLSIESKSLLPFFIQWGKKSRHPSLDAPKGCTIKSFWVETPSPNEMEKGFTQMSIQMPVKYGKEEKLHLSLQTPKGLVSL